MSRIWLALTAFVLLNSMAASLSWLYCSSVPSTVLRTLVSEVSISIAAAPHAAAAAAMGTVRARVALEPTCSMPYPKLWIFPPASPSLPPKSVMAPAAPPISEAVRTRRRRRSSSALAMARPL